MRLKFKPIPIVLEKAIVTEIKMLLHASRDSLRNREVNTLQVTFQNNDPYYCEAFGILRALQCMKYGYFGPCNLDGVEDYRCELPHQNLAWWFERLKEAVLDEEHFVGDHKCAKCYTRYGKDDARG